MLKNVYDVSLVRAVEGTMGRDGLPPSASVSCGHRDGRSRPEDVTLEQTLEAL